jgi:hypothetical protein
MLQDPIFSPWQLTCPSSQTDESMSKATCIPHVRGSEASRNHAYARRVARCVYPKRCNHPKAVPQYRCAYTRRLAFHANTRTRLSGFFSVGRIDATYTLFVSSLVANQVAKVLLQSCNSKCISDSRWKHRGCIELTA